MRWLWQNICRKGTGLEARGRPTGRSGQRRKSRQQTPRRKEHRERGGNQEKAGAGKLRDENVSGRGRCSQHCQTQLKGHAGEVREMSIENVVL